MPYEISNIEKNILTILTVQAPEAMSSPPAIGGRQPSMEPSIHCSTCRWYVPLEAHGVPMGRPMMVQHLQAAHEKVFERAMMRVQLEINGQAADLVGEDRKGADYTLDLLCTIHSYDEMPRPGVAQVYGGVTERMWCCSLCRHVSRSSARQGKGPDQAANDMHAHLDVAHRAEYLTARRLARDAAIHAESKMREGPADPNIGV